MAFALAHLSDVHLGTPAGMPASERNLKRMFGWINWARRRRFMHLADVADRILADLAAQSPGHIAFTGDYANMGLSSELDDGARWIRRLGSPELVSVVPGNHDLYSRRGLGADLGLGAWAPYMLGDGETATLRSLPHEAFPYVRRRGPVALVALNSSVPTPPFLATGRLGPGQLARLERTLADLAREELHRVVLIHHPPLPGLTKPLRDLIDAEALAAVLGRAGAELVVYGHNHRDTLVWHPGPERPIPIVGVASASLAEPHGRQPRARYNLFLFQGGRASSPEIEMVTRGLDETGATVGEIVRRALHPTQH